VTAAAKATIGLFQLRLLPGLFLWMILVAPCARAIAQAKDELPPVMDVPPIVSFFAPLVIPVKTLQDAVLLRDYVTSDEFAAVRKTQGDRRAVNVLFRTALRMSLNNTGEALLICFFASIEHRTVGFNLPLLGPILWLPLTGEFEEDFQERVEALPFALYADTPPEGDRDKLQHFFGSAYLTILIESPDDAESVGDFIEWGEEQFIVGGVNDVRDKRANRQGQRFGKALMDNLNALPMEFMTDDDPKRNP